MTASLRKRHGVVYTPDPIVELILDNALPANSDALANAVVCDPACGDGVFLAAAARRMLARLERKDALRALRRLTGYDIDDAAVAKCKANLDAALNARYPNERVDWNIKARDALQRSLFAGEYGRFTHVIGNPPYVRVQHLERRGRDRIANQWSLIRGATDLYIAFFELGLDLLRKNGTLGFITPSSWIRSDSGSLLRSELVESHAVDKIIDFGEHQLFSDVTTYTAITIIRKGGASESILVETYDGATLNDGGCVMLDRSEPSKPWWIARSASDRERMDRMVERGVRLKEIADIHVGVQTLADKVFIMPCETAERMRLEAWALRPIVKASVMRDGQDPVSRTVIFPYDARGRLLPEAQIRRQAPNVYEWLLSNKRRLLSRDKGRTDPARWHGFGRHVSLVSGFGEKILTSGMNRRPNFQRCPVPEATFYSGYCVKPKPHSPLALDELLATLNSDDMDFFIKTVSKPYQGGWMSYAKSFIGRFPVVVE